MHARVHARARALARARKRKGRRNKVGRGRGIYEAGRQRERRKDEMREKGEREESLV